MGRNKSEFLSAFGTVFEIWKRIVEAVRKLGGSDEDLRQLLTDSSIVDQIATLITGRQEIYRVIVNYGLNLALQIGLGEYDLVADDIDDEHFPFRKSAAPKVNLVLVQFDEYVKTEEAIAQIINKKLRPAFIDELLALGANYPDLQKRFPIVALGSLCEGGRSNMDFPFLGFEDGKRILGKSWGDDVDSWGDHWRFLAAEKA